MTTDQLTHYEALDRLVEMAHENLTDVVAQLVGMQIGNDEAAAHYVMRVDTVQYGIKHAKARLEEAKANKLAFVKSI